MTANADPQAAVLESAITWLKRQRDEHRLATPEWIALDGALDDLRDHFYTGTPLTEDVQGPWAEVEGAPGHTDGSDLPKLCGHGVDADCECRGDDQPTEDGTR